MPLDHTPLELNDFDKEVVNYIEKLTGHIRHAAINALEHLVKAQKIVEIDPEMAAFRAFTAEEEAATALFLTLKKLGYKNSERIRHRDHRFKAGLHPFITAVYHQIYELSLFSAIKLVWEKTPSGEHERRLQLALKEKDSGLYIVPEPPLNFQVSTLDGPTYFEKKIDELCKGVGKEKALEHIEEIANIRNRLLYAGDSGCWRLNEERLSQDIEGCKSRTLLILRILCLIHPYKDQSPFVQQCLDGYLIMMGKITKEEMIT